MGNVEILQPKRQDVWGWPAITNFTLGGAACGFYLFYTLAIHLGMIPSALSRPEALKLLSPLLVAIGFAALIIEGGRPSRGFYLLHGLRNSWMSWEVLAGGIFVFTAVADFFLSGSVFHAAAAVAAAGFVTSQGFIVYRSRAVTSWNVNVFVVPLLFLTSGLSMGAGLAMILSFWVHDFGFSLMMTGLACVVFDLAVWVVFLGLPGGYAYRRATEPLRRPVSVAATVVLGHLIPILLMSMLVLLPLIGMNIEKIFLQIVSLVAGAAIMVGAVSQKTGILLRAGYLRGIVMPRGEGDPAH